MVVQFPLTPHQRRVGPSTLKSVHLNRQEPTSSNRCVAALDVDCLDFAQLRRGFHQPCRRLAEHHAARRSDRLHTLRHPDLVANGGVTERPRTDFTRDHLARVQAHPQPQHDCVAPFDFCGQLGRLDLEIQRGEARANSMVFQRCRRTEHRHDPVAGELVHRAAVPLYDGRTSTGQARHDLAQPLRTDSRRYVHRMNDIGEKNGDLLVLRGADGGVVQRRSATVTEPGVDQRLGSASGARRHGRQNMALAA